jgi:hypothetical protein
MRDINYQRLNLENLPKEHKFYIQLIEWLSPLFSNVSSEKIQTLSEAAYLYFRFLLSFDEFVDVEANRDKINKFSALKQGFSDYELSIRKLTTLFVDNDFWIKFEELRAIYFNTVLLEKKISQRQSNIDVELFEKIAKGKSVICLNSVYGLQFLSENYDFENELIACIEEIHIALQYIDDIDDFKKDILEKQWTYPQVLLDEYLKNQKLDIQDISTKHKYLYLSEIASGSFYKAISHFKNAAKVAKYLELRQLYEYLNTQIKFVYFHLDEIEYLKIKAKSAAQKSNEFLEKQTTTESIYKAISFLEKNRNEDNTWSDFMTSMGMGKAWITNYVALQLAEINTDMPILANLGTEVLEKTEKFGSYNSDIIQDGDSTNFLIGFLQEIDMLPPELENSWYKFMDRESGGWKTYLDMKKLRELLDLDEEISIKGWLNPKVCVSAVSAYVLSKKVDSSEFHKTCQYLLNNKTENYWESYWWTSPIYATAFSIMALSRSDDYYAQVAEASNWLANLQEEEGFWPNPIGKDPSPFYTALALKALYIFDKEIYKYQIAKGKNWLLSHQTLDGSWQTNRILQIPATNIEYPKEVKTWRNSSFGVNCLSDDFNRNFTTSTVINCLATLNNHYVN